MTFTILTPAGFIQSETKGLYAGWKVGKIFGTLDCPSGKRKMKRENRVFFLSYEDAIACGYRPCRVCRPLRQPENAPKQSIFDESSNTENPE